MRHVMQYLAHFSKNGRIIGGRIVCAICRNSANPKVNPFSDNSFFPMVF